MKDFGQRNWVLGLTAGVFLSLAPQLGHAKDPAARVYQFTGKITELTNDTISLRQGQELLEFERDAASAGDLKVGDQATIWYTLEGHKIKAREGKSQQPGQAAPKKVTPPINPPKGIPQPVIDDRAFYDAMNDAARPPRLIDAG